MVKAETCNGKLKFLNDPSKCSEVRPHHEVFGFGGVCVCVGECVWRGVGVGRCTGMPMVY